MKVKKMAAAALVLSSVMALGAVGYAAPAADSVKDIKITALLLWRSQSCGDSLKGYQEP